MKKTNSEEFNKKIEQVTEGEQWREYKKTNSPKVREELILRFAPIVKYTAGKIAITAPDIEYNDLVSYGVIGLIDAIEKFDPTQGIEFKHYAIKRIRGAIIDELRLLDRIPRHMRKKAKQIEDAYIKLENKYEREITDEEVCEELGMTMEEFEEDLLEISGLTTISLDEVWYEGENDYEVPGINLIEAEEEQSPEFIVEREEIKRKLADAINFLSEKEKMVIALYYYEDLTLKEVGKVMDVTESRICQLHAKAITKLRASVKRTMRDFVK
ncbi:TPA: RNA polymerase sigma factor WhiG [bacterium]|nr:RNA polymerase sigma factor WhiG [bacterium]